jgi:transposase
VIGSSRRLRVFAFGEPVDLRKGFEGLQALVTRELGRDPLSGECFLFVSRLRTRAKVLFYDGTGLCLYHKRLESGRFASLFGAGREVALTMSELALYLEGCRAVGKVVLSPSEVVPGRLTGDAVRCIVPTS